MKLILKKLWNESETFMKESSQISYVQLKMNKLDMTGNKVSNKSILKNKKSNELKLSPSH